jgi:hypothetical protein
MLSGGWTFLNQAWQSVKQVIVDELVSPLQQQAQQQQQQLQPPQQHLNLIQRIFVREPRLIPQNCTLQFPSPLFVLKTIQQQRQQQQQLLRQQNHHYETTVGNLQFNLQLMDDVNQPMTSNDNRFVIRESDINIVVTGITDILPQVYDTELFHIKKVCFFPVKSGWYTIHCKVLNTPIGLPKIIYINLVVFYIYKCKISVPFYENKILLTKNETSVLIHTFDQYGNKAITSKETMDRFSVLYNDQLLVDNAQFITRIDPIRSQSNNNNSNPGEYIIRIIPNVTDIHTIQIYYDTTSLLKIDLYILSRNDYMKLNSLDNTSNNSKATANTFQVQYVKHKNNKAKKKDVTLILNDDLIQCVIYRLYFFPRVLWELNLKHLEIILNSSNDQVFTVTEASYKKKMTRVNEQSSTRYTISTEQRTLILATIRLMKKRPMKDLEMKSMLSHLFTHLHELDQSDISQLFNLFVSHQDSYNQFIQFYEGYIRGHATIVLNKFTSNTTSNGSSSNNKIFVDDLLEFHDKMTDEIQKYFNNDSTLNKSLSKVFSEIVNSEIPVKDLKISAITFVTSYCDQILTNNDTTNSNDPQQQQSLNNIITLFKLISDKDVLQELYRRQLAKRLIQRIENETSIYDEKSMLMQLKVNFGYVFTNKMEGMIRDVHSNFHLIDQYNTYLRSRRRIQLSNIQFRPLILTQGYWPTMSDSTSSITTVPRELDSCMNSFNAFYKEHTNGGRTLHWCMQQGSILVNARFWSGEYDIVLPTFYVCLLLSFNQSNELCTKQLFSLLGGTTQKQIAVMLQKLTKCKLLQLKNKNSTVVNADTIYIVNEDFQSNLKKIKMNMEDYSVKIKEKKQVDTTVERDRSFAIEAAIVRIMKSRKTISYKCLMEETAKQLLSYFNPDVKMIKQKIDALMSREYIERDEQDSTILHYMA